ncbi:DUF1566 domain-containing protein [Flavobacterium luteum]|uniref:DUF1566 domain-containing protein n=1 Tax=Flavobacterium luteum TaxID=2026654 RepID=A0A7J5AFQ9_9FLAO|nr:DUF1566 domain-containing protein [Flavobacterium luteum]KAB1156313.1 DUF1566 domain-containing protein [Flavobacterium luteum]
MKKRNPNLLLLFFLFVSFITNAQVGINTTTPNAQLEITSSNQATPNNTDGILIPKIDAFPVTNPTAAQQGMMVYLTTTIGLNPPGFYYWDNTGTPSWKSVGGSGSGSSSSGHYIGELFEGGIIVAVWKESGVEHGLIASLTDIGKAAVGPFQFNVPWTSAAFTSTVVPAPFATNTVDGQTNTSAIIAQNSNAADTAATLCDQYSNSGYNDWYLPSYYELDLCYNAAFLVNKVLGVNGFRLGGYWSSTELSSTNVLLTYFQQGYATPGATKGNGFFVRAVRRF